MCCIDDDDKKVKKPEPTQFFEVDPSLVRFRLELTAPYFSQALWALKPKETADLKTFAVDKHWKWYYGKEVPFPIEEQTTALYHELSHLLRMHPDRAGSRCPQCFNIAADFEINDDLPPNWPKSKHWMYPKDYKLADGKYAEEYYDELEGNVTKKCCQDGHGHSHPDHGDGPGEGSCGSAAGNPKEWEDEGDAAGGLSDIEQEAIRDQVAKAIREHQEQRGDVPGGWLRWAEERFNPVVPWTKVLRTQARRAWIIQQGYTDRTYQRPPRRENPPMLHPRQISRKPVPAFCIDTSGSMSDDMLKQAVGEIYGAIRAHSSSMHVVIGDAKVHDSYTIHVPSEVRKLELHGGGGTDMTVLMEFALNMKPKPNMLIVITDGYTPYMDNPKIPVVVVLTADGEAPDYARVVKINGK
jgi:predicted metal-dependent peptidase